MFRYLRYSFILFLFAASALAQEGLKPLSANINYLYGDLKPKEFNQDHANYYNRSASSMTVTPPLFLDDFSYSPYQSYPIQSLWKDSMTYVNSGYAVAPLSIGVATFDGLNKHGYPYMPNLTDYLSSYPADTLTSIPINLSTFTVADSVALSFYYQARGNGDSPELKDTLLLDYFIPSQNKWTTVWYQRGNTSANTNDSVFKRGFVWLDSAYYFQNGFKFRFRNKATSAGNYDHWNLDYVYLDPYRHILTDTSYTDYSFGYIPTPVLKNYSAMPWRQYDTTDMALKNSVFVRNNGVIGSQLSYTNNFMNSSNISVHTYTSGAVNVPGIFKYAGWIKDTVVSNPRYKYWFPPMTGPTDYTMKHILATPSSDIIKANDTVIKKLGFKNYFAFDDGSAEGGYFVSGQGAKMAAKYVLKKSDTLRSVMIYFDPANPAGSTITNAQQSYSFQINVWLAGSFGPSSVLYKDSVKSVVYYNNEAFNTFPEYQLAIPQILAPGTYYIGIQQKVLTGIPVGFDKNTDHSSSLYYDSGNGWTQSQIYGSIMMRPLFGMSPTVGIKENQTQKINLFSVYPNPSAGEFMIASEKFEKASYEIINALGQKVSEGKIESNQQLITTQNLNTGIYFLILKTNTGLVQQQKIIIQH